MKPFPYSQRVRITAVHAVRNRFGPPTVCGSEMAIVGRFHPLIVHFPIALVMVAAWAEGVALATHDSRWRTVAVINVRAGALFAFAGAIAGWRLASTLGIDSSPLVQWHRGLGVAATVLTGAAAVATFRTSVGSLRDLWMYRISLASAAIAVAATGHLGGLLVWGADFLRP
jgi:uncharacterized membrane protein